MILGQVQFRRDTAANWTSNNPILLSGELGLETDTQKFKIGDGSAAWNTLPYGGIKGDGGATGATGATGAQGQKGWSPVLAVETDGERRVLRVVDWTGGEGTKPTSGQYIGTTGFVATAAEATDIRGPQGQTGVAPTQNTFANVSVGTTPTPTVLQSDLAADTLTVNAGAGISLTADAATDTFTIANAGVTSVNGQSGAVTIPVATAVTRTAPTASASTALTTIQSYPVAAGEIVAGSEYEFYASLRVINTTTATNAVVTLSVGATNVLVLTQAIGTTAAASPGAAVELYGRITFYSATAAEAYIRASKQAAVAFDAVANTSASVTVAAATATTIDLKFNTSGATSTFIARQATIRRVK